MDRNIASRLMVHKVRVGGQSSTGGDPRSVDVLFKELTLLGGDVNFNFLKEVLEAKGFKVKAGSEIEDTPMKYVIVYREGGTPTVEAVLEALTHPEIDLTNVSKIEGNTGS
jgi:hypothetical protein